MEEFCFSIIKVYGFVNGWPFVGVKRHATIEYLLVPKQNRFAGVRKRTVKRQWGSRAGRR